MATLYIQQRPIGLQFFQVASQEEQELASCLFPSPSILRLLGCWGVQIIAIILCGRSLVVMGTVMQGRGLVVIGIVM